MLFNYMLLALSFCEAPCDALSILASRGRIHKDILRTKIILTAVKKKIKKSWEKCKFFQTIRWQLNALGCHISHA